MSNQEMPLSCYEEISQLNKEHRVSIVRHSGTGKIYVKKVLSVYSLAVYSALYDRPVKHTPRICALYEDRGTLTVIEEYISGDSLEEVLEICGSLPEQETIRIAIMLCRILEELHSFTPPLIHRDIKPSNILVTEDGEIVLLDMNAAKFMNTDKAADTRLLGTPGFAAPEQFGFGSSTTATDLYAVGVLMDMLLGRRPATPGLQKIIGKCRELDPANRANAEDPNYRVSALAMTDYECHVSDKSTASMMGQVFLTSACEDIENAMRLMNWCYTEEGIRNNLYGQEGDGYVLEDGKVVLTEKITNNPNGWSLNNALNWYGAQQWLPTCVTLEHWRLISAPESFEALEYFTDAYGDKSMKLPASVALSADDTTEYYSLASDVGTLFAESATKVVTGQLDEAGYRAVIEQAKGMGLDRMTELYQAAYDKYLEEN